MIDLSSIKPGDILYWPAPRRGEQKKYMVLNVNNQTPYGLEMVCICPNGEIYITHRIPANTKAQIL